MVSYLQRIDKEKRKCWKERYACSDHPEDVLRNDLINRIHTMYPEFKYLRDFEWKVDNGFSNRQKGELIFGSDYGIYLIIETKYLNLGTDETAQVFTQNDQLISVREQARKYKEIAAKRFCAEAVKIIGATFTNEDNRIHFLDGDEEIAKEPLKASFDCKVPQPIF
ncbi:10324_t:CDS:2 [Paraglomus brasilianum]|uniref:10324_t:CDS:1 n=1 Tax=Paraglomus brasilianum TaxID=144538 RepID=A0A9N9B6M0_9GLOM|nr:10324_t:CDS:2 [Paraglomus brasilianum]